MANKIAPPAPIHPTDISQAAITDINHLHNTIVKESRKTALKILEVGLRIAAIKDRLDAAIPWGAFVEEHFTFSRGTANNYLRVYEQFKDDPQALEDKTVAEAYALTGITNVRKKLPPPGPAHLDGSDRPLNRDIDTEHLFTQPCIAKVQLTRHRIQAFTDKGSLWMFTRDGAALPVVDVYILPDDAGPTLAAARLDLFRNLQIALEMYYHSVETIDKH